MTTRIISGTPDTMVYFTASPMVSTSLEWRDTIDDLTRPRWWKTSLSRVRSKTRLRNVCDDLDTSTPAPRWAA